MADPRGIRTRAEWTRELQALFARAGLSYHVLAERCGTSTSTLQKMVTGQSFPRPSTVRLFVQECGERDAQPWVDARARVAAADVTLKRTRTPPGRQVRIGAVPRPADCFQEREVADRLEEAAEDGGTVVLTQVLAGMGGVGKTQLAAAYARRVWAQGVGVLVWVNAATRDGVVSAYADAAQALGLPLADRHDPEKSARAFLAWAETTADRWWLVVLDDIRSPADVTGWWPPAAESAAGGRVLVTTRLRAAALAGAGRHTVPVGTFTGPEARAYLHAKLGDRFTSSLAGALADDVGYLPLALAQAVAYITNEDIGIQRYRDLLAARLLHEVVPEEGDLTDDHQRIISATWEISIDQADAARPAGLARPVLQLASMLDPAGIPQAVLSSPPALDHLATYLPGQEHAIDEATVDAVLRVLHRYSLIDHDRTAIYREVRVHQLVQRATRENLKTQGDLGPDLYAALAGTAADALLDLWPQTERDELGQVLRANTTALHDRAGVTLWDQVDGAHQVLFRAVASLGGTGQATAAWTACTELAATAHDRLGPDHPHTLTTRGNLAYWQGEAGDAAGAAAAAEELLADRVRILGPDHPDTLTARGSLASLRGGAGDAIGAAAAYEELLADLLRVLGPDHPHTLTTCGNLAYWQGEAGDAAGAAAAAEELLADRVRILGPDHPDTLTARGSLASLRGKAGDAAGAAAATEELLADRVRILGPDHPDTLTARGNLAQWRGEAGDVAGAAAAYEELLAGCLRVLGPDHPYTLTVRSNLARWRGEAGDAAGAAAATEELLADYLQVLGPDHPDALIVRGNLAYWRGVAGDAAGAAAAAEELLADRLRVLGPDHPHTLTVRASLARWQGQAGDAAGAAAATEELLAGCLRVLGSDHPDTLTARGNLAHWRGVAGDAAGAGAAAEEVLADSLRVLGPDHPDTLRARGSLARWQGQAGDAAGAAAAAEELLADFLRVLGPDHPDTLITRGNLAHWRGVAGDAAGAGAAAEEVLADSLRVLGPDHPDTLRARGSLARWQGQAGDAAGAAAGRGAAGRLSAGAGS